MAEERFLHPPKKIDTALVGIAMAILLQAATGVWWAAKTNSRVDRLEAEMAPVKTVVETVARLDERSKAMDAASQRIERKLDQLDQAK